MTGFRGSPRLHRAAIVVLDPASAAVRRRIVLQYNPDQITRTLQIPADSGGRSTLHRGRTPPVEIIKLEAELDAADALDRGDPIAARSGVGPAIAALETLVYPHTRDLRDIDRLAAAGTLEIAGPDPTFTLFAWGERVAPVRITELAITEEAFDPGLHPLRARVSLGMRVLSVHDLGFGTRAGNLYLTYQQHKELLAGLGPGRTS